MTTNYTLRIDSDIKNECEEMYSNLGMSLSTAINVFLRKSLRVGGLPFDVREEAPNKDTLLAMKELDDMLNNPNTKYYSVEEALKELKK